MLTTVRSRRSVLALVLVLLPALLTAQQSATPRAAASRLGFSAERLARMDSALQRAVDRGEIAGAVALVMRDGQAVYERAVGWADKEARRSADATT
jgi:CubicO group peptidase (beta-lactamase class C family)